MKKTCANCKEEKSIDHFSTDKSKPDGKCNKCKACNKAYYDANRERSSTRSKEYGRNIREKSPETIRKYKREYYHNKLKKSPIYALDQSIIRLIAHAISTKKYSPFTRTAFIIGCNCEDFIAHIESQFAEGMGWKNRGMWEIDHIIPRSYAKTLDDVYILNHYTNLQPLWIAENSAKFKTLPEDIAEKFLELKNRNIFMKTLLKY